MKTNMLFYRISLSCS